MGRSRQAEKAERVPPCHPLPPCRRSMSPRRGAHATCARNEQRGGRARRRERNYLQLTAQLLQLEAGSSGQRAHQPRQSAEQADQNRNEWRKGLGVGEKNEPRTGRSDSCEGARGRNGWSGVHCGRPPKGELVRGGEQKKKETPPGQRIASAAIPPQRRAAVAASSLCLLLARI